MALTPEANPETVEALLDTTWRVVAAEGARTDALDRKASSLATFASVVLSLSGVLGGALVRGHQAVWVFAYFSFGLFLLVCAIGTSVWVLLPKEQLMLGVAYLERFTKWSEILKPRVQVQGETMAGLVEAIALERRVNRRKAQAVRWAFLFLLAGLAATASDAAIVTAGAVL
jgi:hypothetical protein